MRVWVACLGLCLMSLGACITTPNPQPSALPTNQVNPSAPPNSSPPQIKCPVNPQGTLELIAGSKEPGFQDGEASKAKFNYPTSLAFGPDQKLYIADSNNYRIRSIDLDTMQVDTFVGSTEGNQDGKSEASHFSQLDKLTVTDTGDIYVFEKFNSQLRRVTPKKEVSTVIKDAHPIQNQDKPGFKFKDKSNTHSIIFSKNDNKIYFSQGAQFFSLSIPEHQINEINYQIESITIAEKSTADQTALYDPVFEDAVITPNRSIWLTDSHADTIRQFDPKTNKLKVIAGGRFLVNSSHFFLFQDEPGLDAFFRVPEGITYHPNGHFYIVDQGNFLIRQMNSDGCVWTVQVPNKIKTFPNAIQQREADILFDVTTGPDGNLYIAAEHQIFRMKILKTGS